MNERVFNGQFKYSPFIPFDPTANPLLVGYTSLPTVGGLQPFVYTGWREEEMSWHDSCYIHAGLNPFRENIIKGPDALKFLNANLTNGFDNFPVGSIKHAVMVSEAGLLMADGILLRLAEDVFEATCLSPYLEYRASQCDMDVTVESTYGDTFFFQLGGPRSLEIVEAACKEDLHDIGFLQHRMSSIDGMTVRIQRVGMAGSLAYEVHGDFDDSIPVYEALLKAGEPFGLKKLGRHAYWNTHTENGFPQVIIHYPYAVESDPGYLKMLEDTGHPMLFTTASHCKMSGSMGDDIAARYVNPLEIGWQGAVSFGHDFVGKEALQAIAEAGPRKVVTLEWNADDVVDVWRSGLEPGEPYASMDFPEDYNPTGKYSYHADKVLVDGQLVGTSTGRCHSWYYRKMISMGVIDAAYADEGREVVIVWGEPGGRQKEIRATVARWPYMNEARNEDVDVSDIPHPSC